LLDTKALDKTNNTIHPAVMQGYLTVVFFGSIGAFEIERNYLIEKKMLIVYFKENNLVSK